jgi:hypothetical protein
LSQSRGDRITIGPQHLADPGTVGTIERLGSDLIGRSSVSVKAYRRVKAVLDALLLDVGALSFIGWIRIVGERRPKASLTGSRLVENYIDSIYMFY